MWILDGNYPVKTSKERLSYTLTIRLQNVSIFILLNILINWTKIAFNKMIKTYFRLIPHYCCSCLMLCHLLRDNVLTARESQRFEWPLWRSYFVNFSICSLIISTLVSFWIHFQSFFVNNSKTIDPINMKLPAFVHFIILNDENISRRKILHWPH